MKASTHPEGTNVRSTDMTGLASDGSGHARLAILRVFFSKPAFGLMAFVAMLFIGILAAPTEAQDASTGKPGPTSTTATYDDWVVRCRALADDGAEAQEVCEMVHTIRVATAADGNRPAPPRLLAQIAIGRLPRPDGLKVVFQVPSGVSLRQPVVFRLAESTAALVQAEADSLQTATYFRCQSSACLADLDWTEGQAAAALNSSAAQMSFTDGAGRTINIPVSLKGFSSAYADLAN